MKKTLFIIYCVVGFSLTGLNQDKTFEYQGFSVGSSLSGQSYFPRAMMPEIINTGSEYIMYFGYESPTETFIMYATSNDMNSWQVGDTVLFGASDTTDREFIIGGPRVVKLPNGQYRMFYRASQKYSSKPYYHIRSAISTDGKNFTKEGVCIENVYYDNNSNFKHIGHSEFFYDAGNNLRAFLTAKDTTMSDSQPDNIYLAESIDGGLTWSNFVSKYASCHDPVIVRDSSQNYHAYFTYLNTEFKTVTSTNGSLWPATTNKLIMIQNGDTITESSSPIKIADLGAGVNANGDIVIYSNHASSPGPWTHIAYWEDQTSSGIFSQEKVKSVQVFPNPTSGLINIDNLPTELLGYSIYVTNIFGQKVAEYTKNTQINLPDDLANGTYFLHIRDENKNLLYHCPLVLNR